MDVATDETMTVRTWWTLGEDGDEDGDDDNDQDKKQVKQKEISSFPFVVVC